MVSIHIVPVIVYLIIKVISSTFRFKCEIDRLSIPRTEALALPNPVEQTTLEPTPL